MAILNKDCGKLNIKYNAHLVHGTCTSVCIHCHIGPHVHTEAYSDPSHRQWSLPIVSSWQPFNHMWSWNVTSGRNGDVTIACGRDRNMPLCVRVDLWQFHFYSVGSGTKTILWALHNHDRSHKSEGSHLSMKLKTGHIFIGMKNHNVWLCQTECEKIWGPRACM